MTNEQLSKLSEIDNIADSNGGYLDFVPLGRERFDYRKLIQYCKLNGISPLELSDKEKQIFAI